ncbi:Oidioi.mRNA.OKI2018_I69.PAR.g13128.t1.cds [Oikopleura dioica]|uniref:Oidioi.mRNA.OKI2018_I69.PAR.g13128.t1.cds n=1 Tax=Oikopleura dioica TaxID=34765 RepID=A0ABN7S9D1_OIKDI|nr:Oidioi.mRNA.OKI2018_I69.PAR.g13128.t1.cds [Oikopleura dioica]
MLTKGALEPSDGPALSEEQRQKLRQLKVDTQKRDEAYIREHPELDRMCSEFLRDISHKRPTDTTAFAAAWFTNANLQSHIEKKMQEKKPDRDFEFVKDVPNLKL